MKCPYCNSEMTDGYIQSARAIIFTTEPHTVQFWPSKKTGEFWVSSNNWTAPICVAYHCPECKKIIVDYTETVK